MTKSRHVRSNRQIPAPPQHPAEDEERRFFEPLYAEWIPFHDQRPPTLYHYTTAQGLLGIMESNRLWATNVRFLNDPSEIDYAICIIRESLGSVPLPANFHDQVNYRLDESEAEARVYVCCFCLEGDLLSQWRGYGAQGGGYAIGFDTENFGDREVAMPPRPILRRVIYDRETQFRLIRTWLQAVCDLDTAQRAATNRTLRNRLSERMETLVFSFHLMLSQFLVCFKNPAYEGEQEWRLIQFGRVQGNEIIKPAFRPRGGRIIPYATLDMTQPAGKNPGKLPIQGIRFGPTLEPQTAKRSLRLLCEAAGYRVAWGNVAPSIVPFSGF